MLNLKELAEFLVANDYAIVVGGKYKLTVKFHRDLKASENAKPVLQDNPLVPTPANPTTAIVPYVADDWETCYKQFIVDACVPVRCEGRNGDMYYTNRYSEDGMKAFRKAMESGIRYEILVAATALYYKSGVRLKMSIGRFMDSGQWKTHYDELELSSQTGDIKEHIEKTIDNGDFTFTQLG